MALMVLCSHSAIAADLETVSSVDLNRYLGSWYEIARYPNSFEVNCYNATAQYSENSDGSINVLNTCIKQDSGNADVANGLATVADTSSNAKLKVTFLPSWLRWTGIGLGDYWVIQLGDNYEYSVVSEPGRNYLWILSRTPEVDAATYAKIIARLVEQGFDISKIENSRR